MAKGKSGPERISTLEGDGARGKPGCERVSTLNEDNGRSGCELLSTLEAPLSLKKQERWARNTVGDKVSFGTSLATSAPEFSAHRFVKV